MYQPRALPIDGKPITCNAEWRTMRGHPGRTRPAAGLSKSKRKEGIIKRALPSACGSRARCPAADPFRRHPAHTMLHRPDKGIEAGEPRGLAPPRPAASPLTRRTSETPSFPFLSPLFSALFLSICTHLLRRREQDLARLVPARRHGDGAPGGGEGTVVLAGQGAAGVKAGEGGGRAETKNCEH